MNFLAPLQQHPRLAAIGAITAGLIMGAFPQARKTVGLVALQVLRRALAGQAGVPKLPR